MYLITLLYIKVPQDLFPSCYYSFHLQRHLKDPERLAFFRHRENASIALISLCIFGVNPPLVTLSSHQLRWFNNVT